MADSKITALTAISTVDPTADPLVIVDVSDTSMAASGTTKKSTINQLLGAGGTATLASATITGDLTVDTSTLKVDSANDRVGVGTASPASQFHIFNSGATTDTYLEIQNGTASTYIGTRGTTFGAMDAGDSYIFNSSGNDVVLMAANASGAIKFAAGGSTESMRLNSTGLGVGGSPTRKLSIVGSGNTYANINSGDNTSLVGVLFGGTSAPSNGQIIYNNTDNSMGLHTAGATRLTIDSSGNLGIGVSTFGTSAAKVLGLANATAPSTSPAGMGQLYVEAGALKYRGSSGTVTTIAAA